MRRPIADRLARPAARGTRAALAMPILVVLPALLALAGCAEERIVVARPERLDFGAVRVGTAPVKTVTFENRSDEPQTFELSVTGPDYGVFRVRPRRVTLQPREKAEVEVALVNTRTGALEARLVTIGEEADPLVRILAEGLEAVDAGASETDAGADAGADIGVDAGADGGEPE